MLKEYNLSSRTIQNIMLKIAIWVPVILMAIIIFGFSKQDGTESSGLSEKVAAAIVDSADNIGIINVDKDNRTEYIEILQTPIRKGAHMTEYAILGLLVFLALYVDGLKNKIIYGVHYIYGLTVVLVFLFACSDEFHQLFVPGRSGKFTDVLIDMCGCVIAMLVCWAVRNKKE